MTRILITDDDASVPLVVAETLRVAGHTVDEASDGQRGFAVCRSEMPDAVITVPANSLITGNPVSFLGVPEN